MSALLKLVLLVTVVASVSCNSIGELRLRLETELKDLDQNFQLTSRAFYEKQELAEGLIKSGYGGHASGLMNLAQVATFIETIKYAIRRKSVLVAQEVLSSDRLAQKPLAAAFVSRALLRGYADAGRFTAQILKWLYKIIDKATEGQINANIRLAALEALKRNEQFELASEKAASEYEMQIKQTLASMGIDQTEGRFIVSVLDNHMNELLGCSKCRAINRRGDYFNTMPMFDSELDVKKLVESFIDQQLLEACLNEQNFVYPVSESEQEQVSQEDIQRVLRKVLSN